MEERTPETFEVWSKPLGTWLEIHASPTTDGISILFADISNRKRLEEQIKKSEQQARHLIQYAPAAIYEIDFRGPRLTSVNDLMCSYSGYSREELLALDPFELIVEEDRPLFRERIGRVAAGEVVPATVEYRSKMKHGEVRWAALNTSLIYEDGKPVGAFVIAYDVTERRRFELEREQLNASMGATNEILEAALTCRTEEELGRSCLAVAQRVTTSKFGFIGEIGSDGLLHDIAISDSGMQDQTGHRCPPDDFELHGLYGRVLLDGESLLTNSPADYPDGIGTPEGDPALTTFLGVPLKQTGRTIGLIALGNREGGYTDRERELIEGLAPTIVQAFERARAEEALRRSEEESRFLADVVERADIAFGVGAPDGRLVLFNQAFADLTGYSRAELEERALTWSSDLTPPEWRDKEAGLLAGAVRARKAVRYEKEYLRKDGSRVPIELFVQPIFDEAGNLLHYRSFLGEISERKRAEQRRSGKARPSCARWPPNASWPSMPPSLVGGTTTR